MPRTYTPQHEKKPQKQAELVRGGAGDWVIIDGKFYDPKRHVWILKCRGCGKSFYAKRKDAKTHSPACRKRVQRRTLKQNYGVNDAIQHGHKAQLLELGF